ncbi:ead/Ea22-like family protein [Escherichia coli]|uniref:ead/Ea22-like family protein n=1 Tax=Escherichia coli TaxID=562 RepID=UPI000FB5A546|nr:ead/Ea22-like family protein [Escherichia coli]ELK1257911.1 ead/Ea22-like family protein [Escherichia coli]MCW9857468.1 ead/Ea22-like family protein [Escherichia coli]MHN61669.1 ead/Ea22-like family protein [Escherichia coli]
MSEINYQALREIAKQATQGEWVAFISSGTGTYAVHTPGDKRCEDVIKWTGFDGQENAENNARYIAAFNPEVVQALLDERERNQQYIKRRDQENEDIALTVGKLRVELEAAENNLIDSECHVAELEEALRDKQALLEASEKRIAELEAEPVSQAYKLNALDGNSPVTPDGWVMVPKRLTAENGAKGVLSGEFSETTFISCPECFGDDDCETCDCSGRIEIKVPVSWTTIKTIWAKGCEHFSIVAPQQDG